MCMNSNATFHTLKQNNLRKRVTASTMCNTMRQILASLAQQGPCTTAPPTPSVMRNPSFDMRNQPRAKCRERDLAMKRSRMQLKSTLTHHKVCGASPMHLEGFLCLRRPSGIIRKFWNHTTQISASLVQGALHKWGPGPGLTASIAGPSLPEARQPACGERHLLVPPSPAPGCAVPDESPI